MKTRNLAIITILLCVIMSYVGLVSAQSSTNDLGNGSLLSLTITKSGFSAGDMIDIHGNSLPNYHVELTLVGPNGTTQDSRSTFSDRDGQFFSYLLIPKYAQGGTWKILGKSGTYNAELDFDIFEPQPGTTCQGCFLQELNNTKPTVTQINESPLEQFKSGISLEDIQCKDGLFLAISNEKNPMCLESGTISKLASRGLLYGAKQDSETTILIPPGSEDPTSNKTYSPDVTTVVIGINNTVTWVNQAIAGNSIASDIPVVQNLDTFGSSSLRPGDSYRYTFTEPGVFKYHGAPHPWQRGTINVLSIPILANLTAQQPNTTNFSENNTDTVNIVNKIFYFTTLNDTLSSYHGVAAIPFTFHGIDFTLFPSAFSPGPPSNSTLSCGSTNFSSEVTFTDGTHENLNVQIPGPPCSENYTQTALSSHKNPQAGVQVYQGKIRLLANVQQTSENHTLPASFMPCDTPYPQNGTGETVLYMPVNSIGKVCVRYHNLNNFTAPLRVRIFEANNMTQDATEITTWNDAKNNTIPTGNSTIVYWIKTGNHTGFYGFSLFCGGLPLAVGYDNNSTLVVSDFPYLLGGGQIFCPSQTYDYHIDSMTGIGVKYIPPK